MKGLKLLTLCFGLALTACNSGGGGSNSVGFLQRAVISLDTEDKNKKPFEYNIDDEVMSNDYQSQKKISCYHDAEKKTLYASYGKYKEVKKENSKLDYEAESSLNIHFTDVKLDANSEQVLSQDLILSSYYLYLKSNSNEETYHWSGFSIDKSNCTFKLAQTGKSATIEGECAPAIVYNEDRSSEYIGKLQVRFDCQLR